MADSASNYDECPVCLGTGEYQDEECEFCDGCGLLTVETLENDKDAVEEWDYIEYTTYRTQREQKKRHFKHSTDEIVIEGGPSFFDCPGTPRQDIPVSRG